MPAKHASEPARSDGAELAQAAFDGGEPKGARPYTGPPVAVPRLRADLIVTADLDDDCSDNDDDGDGESYDRSLATIREEDSEDLLDDEEDQQTQEQWEAEEDEAEEELKLTASPPPLTRTVTPPLDLTKLPSRMEEDEDARWDEATDGDDEELSERSAGGSSSGIE